MLKNCIKLIRFCSNQTDFGYQKVKIQEKQKLVDSVFHSVATQYDFMNDLMSFTVHRCWKNQFVKQMGNLAHNNHQNNKVRVLDMAGGTGDIAFNIYKKNPGVQIIVGDINDSMLQQGINRAKNERMQIQFRNINAQELPFQQNTFDLYSIGLIFQQAFGIRNVPRKQKAINQAFRVLKRGGRIMILQFSKVENAVFREIYINYSRMVIPLMGKYICNDSKSYQYLVQSIQKFDTQQQLLEKLCVSGFKYSNFVNLSGGIVAIHSGFKL